MTQQNAEQTTKHNPQRYESFESKRVDDYAKARHVAAFVYTFLTHEPPGINGLDHPDYRVRVRRRTDRKGEYFDVVSYRRLGLKKEIAKNKDVISAVESQPDDSPSPRKRNGKKARKLAAQLKQNS